jgi:hypothetical protein
VDRRHILLRIIGPEHEQQINGFKYYPVASMTGTCYGLLSSGRITTAVYECSFQFVLEAKDWDLVRCAAQFWCYGHLEETN